MSIHTSRRSIRTAGLLSLVSAAGLVLAGCAGTAADADSAGFTVAVPQANDSDDFYAKTVQKYADEAGIEVEIVSYPSESYATQITTQLQGGNAADLMIVAPGSGEAGALIPLAEAGLLAPLSGGSADTVPAGDEAMFQVDSDTFGQPTVLSPIGLVYNAAAAAEVGVDAMPDDFAGLLEACATAREGGKVFTVIAGSVPNNTGLLADILAATRVYADAPDWNEQRTAGDVTFADSGWRQVLEDILALNENGCLQDGAAGGSFDSITNEIGGETALSAPVPGAAATSINSATGLSLTVQAFPPPAGTPERLILSPNYAWIVAETADEDTRAEIQDFLDWVAQPEEAQALADLAGMIPITGIDADALPAPYAEVGDLLESGETVASPANGWPNATVYEVLGGGVQGLLTGQKTVDAVLAEMDEAWGD